MSDVIRTNSEGRINKYTLYHTEGLVKQDSKLIKITDIEQVIKSKIRGNALLEYLKQENQQSATTTNGINWKGFERVLSCFAIHRRFSFLQLIHNWQNVGS